MTPDIDCLYCGESVPVKVTLEDNAFEEYLSIDGFSWESEPIPEITVCIRLDLEALARDIDRLLREERERNEKWKVRSDKLE